MRLAVIGAGYVGLVYGVSFANMGNDVVCYDSDAKRIYDLNQGKLPIYEPGLEEMFLKVKEDKKIVFTALPHKAITESDLVFICVGTPADKTGKADLTQVFGVAKLIAENMNSYKAIIIKSTVPVGTNAKVKEIIAKHNKTKVRFDVVSNPEFLREGAALKDFEVPDRIIVGVETEEAENLMSCLYGPITRVGKPLVITTPKNAELIKYASNAMLATRISFMNQLSYLCEKTGADIKEVAKGMGLDTRIGPRFLQAGIGYGGSCFPKDVRALTSTLHEYGCNASLFEAVDAINTAQKTIVVDKLKGIMDLKGKTVTVWGLSFKPKTDDVREAPAIEIIKMLQAEGVKVNAFDPIAVPNAKKVLKDVTYFSNPFESVFESNVLIVATEWNDFKSINMKKAYVLLKDKILIDGRNIYDAEDMVKIGFTYIPIGKPLIMRDVK